MEQLPKKYKRIESKKDSKVLEWFATHYSKSVAVEVKMKGGKVKDHQSAALSEVARGVFQYKIPDMGRTNPFDGFVLKNADAFIVVCDGNYCKCTRVNDGFTFDIYI